MCVHVPAGNLFLVVGMTSAVAVLAASFVLWPVSEVECGSKQLQRLAGAPATAFWLATFAWDLLAFSFSAAGTPPLAVSGTPQISTLSRDHREVILASLGVPQRFDFRQTSRI